MAMELFWAASTSVEADAAAMKALAVLAEKGDESEAIHKVATRDVEWVSRELMGCIGYDGPDIPTTLEAELEAGWPFGITASRFGEEYRVGDEFGELKLYGESVRPSVADALAEELGKYDTTVDGASPLFNIYRRAIHLAASDPVRALYGVKVGEDGSDAEQPEVRIETQKVIRERVVEREKEPVLEGMLRQAMMDAMVGLNIGELTDEIRARLVEEFGFEPVRHEVTVGGDSRPVDGIVHGKFDEVLHWVANDVPCYLYGQAGAGKGVLGRQVAQALGLDYHFMTAVTDEFKINGYMDAYGVYHESPFYRAFKNGGVFFIDELDASAPEVLVCLNIAISDRRYTFPHESCEAHPDFRIIAAGNTLATGADATYVGRMQLDAASLDRFAVVEVGYDEGIETLCAEGDSELVAFAHEFRRSAQKSGLPAICSYRGISHIKVGEAALPLEEVLRSCLCKEMNQDDINIVANGMDLPGNRYLDALANAKSMVG